MEPKSLKFDLSCVEFSKKDKKRDVRIPTVMNNELAEEIGIYVGDGSMNIYNYTSRGNYWLQFTGNASEELEYYKNHVFNLLKRIYNICGNILFSKKDNSLCLRIYSKAVTTFKIKVLKLPFGKQKARNAFIPEFLFTSKEFLASFLRGLADSDFTLTFKKKHKNFHYYPIIKAGFASEKLINDISKALNILGFEYDAQLNVKINLNGKVFKRNEIYICGKNNLKKWMKIIGFSNPKHLTKYFIWRKFGFCPPNTTLNQRLLVLNDKMNISKITPW